MQIVLLNIAYPIVYSTRAQGTSVRGSPPYTVIPTGAKHTKQEYAWRLQVKKLKKEDENSKNIQI
jgi:hypothetical protein